MPDTLYGGVEGEVFFLRAGATGDGTRVLAAVAGMITVWKPLGTGAVAPPVVLQATASFRSGAGGEQEGDAGGGERPGFQGGEWGARGGMTMEKLGE